MAGPVWAGRIGVVRLGTEIAPVCKKVRVRVGWGGVGWVRPEGWSRTHELQAAGGREQEAPCTGPDAM